jgi:hypothetical protein
LAHYTGWSNKRSYKVLPSTPEGLSEQQHAANEHRVPEEDPYSANGGIVDTDSDIEDNRAYRGEMVRMDRSALMAAMRKHLWRERLNSATGNVATPKAGGTGVPGGSAVPISSSDNKFPLVVIGSCGDVAFLAGSNCSWHSCGFLRRESRRRSSNHSEWCGFTATDTFLIYSFSSNSPTLGVPNTGQRLRVRLLHVFEAKIEVLQDSAKGRTLTIDFNKCHKAASAQVPTYR